MQTIQIGLSKFTYWGIWIPILSITYSTSHTKHNAIGKSE